MFPFYIRFMGHCCINTLYYLKIKKKRGNLNTRLAKLDASDSPFSALILAYAGLHRLQWDSRISSILAFDHCLYAVGQGALAIECCSTDTRTLQLVQALDHLDTRLCCTAERTLMKALEGGCSVPIGVCTERINLEKAEEAGNETRRLRLVGSVTSLDGKQCVVEEDVLDVMQDVQKAEDLGKRVAVKLLKNGANEILEEIRRNKQFALIP